MSRARDLANGTFSGAFSADSPTLVVDDANNRVGVGTASPQAPAGILAKTTTYEGLELVTPTGDGSGEFHIGVHQNGSTAGRSIVFKRGGTDGMDTESARIDNNGALLVGIASSSGNRFAVSDDGIRSRWYVTTSGAVGSYNLGTGTVTCSSGIIGFSSDERLKIEDGVFSGGLDKTMQIVPQYFYWKDEEGNQDSNRPRELGFFAQNIQEVCGQEVVPDPHREDVFLGIHDRGVMAVMVSAIQELNAKVEACEAKNTEQQALIEDLQTRLAALETP